MKDFTSKSDEELWRIAASRDGNAFGELFERHADAVYNHCFRRVASWAVAEDLTSTVFLEAWRKRKTVRFQGESVLPWLLAVANYSIRNSNRSLRRYRRLLSKLPRETAIPDQSDEAIGRIDDERAMEIILSIFDQLSEQDQEIISLCDWSGLSYEEAALALEVPVGTIRSRLSRARARLRQHLDDAEAERSLRQDGNGGES